MVRVLDRRLWLGFLLGVAAAVGGQALVRDVEASRPRERESFQQAVELVLDQYVEPVDASALMGRGLKHMVSGLDPYSHYLTAQERRLAQRKQLEGGTTGLISSLHSASGRRGAELEVTAVLPGSSAERLGLRAGDRILELRGQSTAFLLSQAEVEVLLAGGVGERVAATVQRGTRRAPEPIELEFERIDAGALVEGELVHAAGRDVALLRIRSFRAGTGEAVLETLADLRRSAGEAGLLGLVVDLRGNPGGEVAEALIVADQFIADGILTRTRGRGGRILREERAHRAGTDTTTPLIVLQDHRSASAAELLAAALQDHARAKVVGQRSYGKGTVQQVTGLEDGSLLTLTIARYYSPNDRVIDGHGVEPDLVLPSGEDPIAAATRLLLDPSSR